MHPSAVTDPQEAVEMAAASHEGGRETYRRHVSRNLLESARSPGSGHDAFRQGVLGRVGAQALPRRGEVAVCRCG